MNRISPVELTHRANFCHKFHLRRPAANGQAKAALCNKSVTAHRLKGCAGGVVVSYAADEVISRCHSDLAPMLHPHLGRAQRMPRRVQADADAANLP